MLKNDKKEKFSLRKYKNGRTDSKLIGATIVALGLGFAVSGNSALAADEAN